MPIYDPAGHPRLCPEARALDSAELAAYADEAEALFGLRDDSRYAGADAEDLTLAIVRQVNLTARLEQLGGGALAGEKRGDQSLTVARESASGRAVQVDAIAQSIVDRVRAASLPPSSVEPTAWPIAGALR